MNEFCIKEYGRTELAVKYFTALVPESAWRKLRSWIELNADLMRSLRAAGYTGRRRSFTPQQVSLIVHYLGEP